MRMHGLCTRVIKLLACNYFFHRRPLDKIDSIMNTLTPIFLDTATLPFILYLIASYLNSADERTAG